MVDQIAVVTFTTPASGDSATFDVTSPDITEAFSAAIFLVGGTDTDSSDASHGRMGIGFCAPDGGAATEEHAIAIVAENAGAGGTTPDTGTIHATTNCIVVGDPLAVAGAEKVLAQYDSSISGGVRLNFSVRTEQVKVTAILFAGLSRAYTDACGFSTVESGENVGGTTDFEPDLVIFAASNGAVNTDQNDAIPNIGFAINDSGPSQVSSYVSADDATEPTDADGYIRSDAAYAHFSGTASRTMEYVQVTSFNSTGFNGVASSGLAINAHYLALKWTNPSRVRVACANMAVSGATGVQTFNGFGFPPDIVLGMSTLLASVDTLIDGPTASCSGYFTTGRYASRAYTWHHEEGLTGTDVWNAHSRSEDAAVLTYDHAGTVAQRASWEGPSGSGGFRLNFSTATAGYLTALGIQIIPTSPAPRRRLPARRARARRVRRLLSVFPKAPASPLPARFWKAIQRIRRGFLLRRRARPPLPEMEVLVGAAAEEAKGRIFTPGLIRGQIVADQGPARGRVFTPGLVRGRVSYPGNFPEPENPT